jgi:UDP-glucose 4-epimerase
MMKVLLTGASSFTGFWFARLLAARGHEVVAPLFRDRSAYADGPRAERVRRLGLFAEIVEDCAFGAPNFIDLARSGEFDLLCHHAAQVGDYRSPDFDIAQALASNTRELRAVLAAGAFKGVVFTGSVFENGEGAGEEPLVAFSPYGLSKALTAQVVEHRCREACVPYGKFVIPNPFGPLEEPRFCSYLMRCWKAGQSAKVNTPAYVRDNIHVGLLAAAYCRFSEEMAAGSGRAKLNPSGYVEAQGAFAERFAREMRARFGLDCALDLSRQTEFAEPSMRVNTDPAVLYVSGWDEAAAWDEAAEGYR